MVALADHLGWEKYHIIGHSMGGKVIQRLMADFPDRIKSAVAVAPCPACALPFDEPTWNLFAGADASVDQRMQIFRLSTGNRLTDTWYETITAKSVKMSKPAAFREYLDSWVNYDMVEDIRGNATPIKVIVGEHDPDLRFELMQNTYGQWLPHAKITKLLNCGHYPMLETPLSLAAECEAFLDQHK
jgi:pimeloyl-ACP methyl ester carboxylesterase